MLARRSPIPRTRPPGIPRPEDSLCGEPTIDGQRSAGDEGRLIGCEEQDCVGPLVRPADAAYRMVLVRLLHVLIEVSGRLCLVREHGCVDASRVHGIDTYAEGCVVERHRLRHYRYGTFGGAVGRTSPVA